MFVINQILTEFFSFRDNLANPNVSRIIFQLPILPRDVYA